MRNLTILLMIALLGGILSCQKEDDKKGPIAAFKVDPPIGPFTTIFLFDATETTNEGESANNLKVRWDWEGDGIWDTEFSRNKLRNHKYEDAGDYNVILEVMNTTGWTDTETYPVIVYPDSIPPIAEFKSTPDTSFVNTIFHFNAGSSWDVYDSITELRFRWNFDGDSTWDTPFTCDTCAFHKYTRPGSYRVILQVRNKVHLTDTIGKPIYVFDI